MSFHVLRKWLVFFLASCLGILAGLLMMLRLAMSQAGWLEPHVESLLESRLGAPVAGIRPQPKYATKNTTSGP
jgi:hypothetical protein